MKKIAISIILLIYVNSMGQVDVGLPSFVFAGGGVQWQELPHKKNLWLAQVHVGWELLWPQSATLWHSYVEYQSLSQDFMRKANDRWARSMYLGGVSSYRVYGGTYQRGWNPFMQTGLGGGLVWEHEQHKLEFWPMVGVGVDWRLHSNFKMVLLCNWVRFNRLQVLMHVGTGNYLF
jgi:hypothetical protein